MQINAASQSEASSLLGVATSMPANNVSIKERYLVYFPGVLAGLPFGKLTGDRIGFVSGVGL